MSPRKPSRTLIDLSMEACRRLVEMESLRIAKFSITNFIIEDEDEVINEEMEDKREEFIKDQVHAFKIHFFSYIASNLIRFEDRIFVSIQNGIEDAIAVKKRTWTATTDLTVFTKEMYAITKMSDLLVLSSRPALDLDKLPKIIRSRMYGNLGAFTSCRKLILGSGSGGWVTEAYADKFLLGIPSMTQLTHFSLKYDCTVNILQVLAETCYETLRVLDIERSRQVRNDSIPFISKFRNLQSLNMFQCDFSTRDQLRILLNLKDLIHLERGDFLGDIADELTDSAEYADIEPRFKIREFWASEEYYFHPQEQMLNVARYFPGIRKMLYMFQPSRSAELSVLSLFPELENIDLWGGAFYSEGTYGLLCEIGQRLTKLSLVHAEELDKQAIALITRYCPRLRSLGFHNCEFVDLPAFNVANGSEEREREKELRKMVRPLLDLRTIKIVSSCSSSYVSWILGPCLNVEKIYIGLSTSIDDQCLFDITAVNGLRHLEFLNIQKCKNVTMAGVMHLIENCPKLRILRDIFYFDDIPESERKRLMEYIRINNLDLTIMHQDLGCHNERFMKTALTQELMDNSPEWDS